MVTCPRCRHRSPVGTGTCTSCGASLADTRPDAGRQPAQVIYGQTDATPEWPELAGFQLAPGDRVDGKYVIDRPLRQGGMAEVYRVKPLGANASQGLALKVLPGRCFDGPTLVERFRQEATLARDLHHPNTVQALDYGELPTFHYLAMELATGWWATDGVVALDTSELPKPLGEAVFLAILRQVCQGLAYVHQRGMIHRDIKPSNLLLFDWGQVKLADFGIARSTETSPLTALGLALGTAEYMSPEQVEATRELTPQSDIYSLGVVMYELLTGVSPFSRPTPLATAIAQLREVPSPPREHNPLIGEGLEQIILRCLEKGVAQRFDSATVLFEALMGYEREVATRLLRDGSSEARQPPLLGLLGQVRPLEDASAVSPGPAIAPASAPEETPVQPVPFDPVSKTHAIEFEPLVRPAEPGLATPAGGERTEPRAAAIPREADVPGAHTEVAPVAEMPSRTTPPPARAKPDLQEPAADPRVTVPAVAAPAETVDRTQRSGILTWAIGLAGIGLVSGVVAVLILRLGGLAPNESVDLSAATGPDATAPSSAPTATAAAPTVIPTAPGAPSSGAVGWAESPGGWSVLRIKLARPSAVAVDSAGTLFVADTGTNRVRKIAPSGELLKEWGRRGTGPGEFDTPVAIAVDARGDVYVADSNNHRIQKFSPDGEPHAQWGGRRGNGPGEFIQPFGLAIDLQGNLYVADAGNYRVQKLSPTGEPLAAFGTAGSAPGQFSGLWGLAVDREGNVYVSEQQNHRIQKLSPAGAPLAEFGAADPSPGQLKTPAGIATDADGNVLVADAGAHRVQQLTPDGGVVASWGTLGKREQDELDTPLGVAADQRGTLYIADSYNNRIVRITAALPRYWWEQR